MIRRPPRSTLFPTRRSSDLFEGICIGRRGGGINESFTVRKISAGVGVERVFPLHAPSIAEIELVRKGRGRRGQALLPPRGPPPNAPGAGERGAAGAPRRAEPAAGG